MKLIVSKDKFIIWICLISACIFNYILNNIYLTLAIVIPAVLVSCKRMIQKPIFILDICLFLYTGALGLLPSISFGVATFNWSGVFVILFFYLLFFVIINKIKIKLDFVFLCTIIYALLIVQGALVASILYNQNFFTGIFVLRESFIYFCLVLGMAICRQKKFNYDKESYINELLHFGKICSIVYLIELVLLYLNIPILNYSYSYRWGYRISATPTLQIFCSFIEIFYYLTHDNRKSIGWLTLFCLEIVFINQSRMRIFGYVFGLFIILVLNSKNNKRKYEVLGIFALCILILALNKSVRNVISSSLIEAASNNSGNIFYRTVEKKYFNDKLKGNELFGVGIPNMRSGEAALYSGKTVNTTIDGYFFQGFYLSDLGDYTEKYYWGYLGYVLYWFMYLFLLMYFIIDFYKKHNYSSCDFAALGFLIIIAFTRSTLEYFVSGNFSFLFLFYELSRLHNLEKRNGSYSLTVRRSAEAERSI